MKPKYTIGVTGLNAIDSPGPGLNVIRSLKEAKSFDVKIVGLFYENLEPLIYMKKFTDNNYQITMPTMGVNNLIKRIEYIHNKESLDMIIPNFDSELFNYIKISDLLLSKFNIKTFLPKNETYETIQKSELGNFGDDKVIFVPKSFMVQSHEEIKKIEENLEFPLVVKGRFYEAQIVHTIAQAEYAFNKFADKWGIPIIFQQYISGYEVNVCGLGDGMGNLIGAVPMRKLFITDKGKAWAGVTLENPTLIKITQKFIEKSRWKGPFELEFICEEKKKNEEKYYLLEVNPRFPAWCYLTTAVGQNLAEAMVNLTMGNEVKPFETYKTGKMFIRYSYDEIVELSEFEKISLKNEN